MKGNEVAHDAIKENKGKHEEKDANEERVPAQAQRERKGTTKDGMERI
jgi:hypothetical protein